MMREAGRSAGSTTRELDLDGLIAIVRLRWYVPLFTIAMMLALSILVARLTRPLFDAGARVQLDRSQEADITALFDPLHADDAAIDTEIAQIRSRAIAENVARQLKLPEVEPGGGAVPDRVIDWLLRDLVVEREPETYVVGVFYRSPNPLAAANVTNAFVQEYLRMSVARRIGAASRDARVMDARTTALAREVRAADEAAAQYRAAHGIAQGIGRNTITDQMVAPLTGQLANAEAKAAVQRAIAGAARTQAARGDIDAVPNITGSAAIGDLRHQRADLLRQQASIGQRYGPLHPEAQRIARQVTDLDQQIAAQSQQLLGALEENARAADAGATNLRGQLAGLQSQQATDGQARVTADALQRDADTKRAAYEQLAIGRQATEQAQRDLEPKAVVIDWATPPTGRVWPRGGLLMMLGLVSGLSLGLFAMLVLELIRPGLRREAEIEEILGLPLIAAVPAIAARAMKSEDGAEADMAGLVARAPMSAQADALRMIRSRIAADPAAKVVAIVSSVAGEGRSGIATALGTVMALSGDRVLLIDDGARAEPISAQLAQTVDRHDALVSAPTAGSLRIVRGWAQIDGAALRAFLAEARPLYDHVLIDTPPLTGSIAARATASFSDAALLIVRWGRTPAPAIRAALGALGRDPDRFVLGVILTRARISIGWRGRLHALFDRGEGYSPAAEPA